MPVWVIQLLAGIALRYLQWVTEYAKNNPNTLKVVEPTEKDKEKWNDALNYINGYLRR